MKELIGIQTAHLARATIDDWDEIRKIEASIEAYVKVARQDKDLIETVGGVLTNHMILKWHKGRILAEMDKQTPGDYQRSHDVTVAPSYADLGINKMQASREQLVKAFIDEDEIWEHCAKLLDDGEPPTFSYFLDLARSRKREMEAIERGNLDLPVLPTGKYRTIVIDPPWEYVK